MSTNSSWVPNESSQTLFSERGWLQGVLVSAVAYGVTVPLYILSSHLLLRGRNRMDSKYRIPLQVYITILFLLGTLFMCALSGFTQMAFIDDRNFPGGPSAYENAMFSIPSDDSGNAAFVLTNWMCDALLVWRFKVIYQMSRAPLWVVMFFPCLMLACSMALGIGFLIQVSTTNPYDTKGVNFTAPYISVSLALNILLTIAIVLRLLAFKYRTIAALGPKYGTQYTSIAAMIIESAALYSAVSIALLTLFGLQNPVSEVFIQSLNQFQAIATLLIVFRVAQGKGWNEQTATYMMTGRRSGHLELGRMRFATPGGSMTLASAGEVPNNSNVDIQDGSHVSNNILV